MANFRRWLIIICKVITVVFLFFYLPSCFVYLVSPSQWWLMGILGIAFPYLWIFLLLLVFTWILIRWRSAVILFALLLCGLQVMKNAFALQEGEKIHPIKSKGEVRLMQWNCNGLQGFLRHPAQMLTERFKAVEFLRRYNPDIICIQDFSNSIASYAKSNISLLTDTLGYKYFVYTQHYKAVTKGLKEGIGIAIFSKLPLIDSGKIYYKGKVNPESIIWATTLVGGKPLRIATTHLQSMHLAGKVNGRLSSDLSEDSLVIIHGTMIEKLKYFQKYHQHQAGMLNKFLDSCRTPLIFTADLNSVPTSWVYKRVKDAGLQDAFSSNGFGFGRTYHSKQPALRIDYIFYNRFIKASATSVFQTSFSDHDPVIMDFTIP